MPQYGELASDRQADVVVIGGGLIGLTAALLLADEDAEVVLLEAGRIGSRTSGSTTGKVTSQHGLLYAELVDRHGRDKAAQYAEANQAAMEQVVDLADSLDIDCELTRSPSFVYSADPAKREVLRQEAEAALSLGLPASFVDAAEVGLPADGAVRFDDQVQLHPTRYLAGIAAAVTDRGAQIFENTRAVEVEETGDLVEVRTERGPVVRARHVVMATLTPMGVTGGYFARTRPSQSHGIALRLPEVAPLGMAISIDSPARSTRPWPGGGPNGLIVVGSGHETGAVDDLESKYQSLIDWVGSTWNFTAEPEYRWSAQDFSTPDLLPYVGRSSGSKAILVATGMHKWGLTNGTAAAGLLRDLVTGRTNPWQDLYDAGRIGDARAVASLVKDNLKVGKEFATGHLQRAVGGHLDHVEVGQGGLFDLDGDVVGAYRDPGGQLHAVKPVCTHLGCTLRWNNADTTWDCNCHGSRFAPDGRVLDGPAVKPLEQADNTHRGGGPV